MNTKILCLAVLRSGAASGYEIKKTLNEPPFSYFQDTGFGSIYPALRQLTENGHVTVSEHAQEKRPDKKVYTLSETGLTLLKEALSTEPQPDRFRSEFCFLLYMGDLVDREHVLKAIDERLAHLKQECQDMQENFPAEAPPTLRLLHRYGYGYHQFGHQSLITLREDLIREWEEADKQSAAATLPV